MCPETVVQKVGKTTNLFLASILQPIASEELEEFGARSKREVCWPSRLESIAQTRMKGRVGQEVRRGRIHWWVLSSGSCSPAASSDCVGIRGERPEALHRLEGICISFPGRARKVARCQSR